MWVNLFGKDILGDSFKTGDQYHSLLDLSDGQYCALHDLWLYSTVMRGGETCVVFKKNDAEHNRTHIRLFQDSIHPHVISNVQK